MKALPLQLDSFQSVQEFRDRLAKVTDKIDSLILSAAIVQQSPIRRMTKDGFEETFQVNVLAQVLLINSLLPFLLKSSVPRIVTVTSRLHLPGSYGDPVNFSFDDPNLNSGYSPTRAYKNSKLNVLWITTEFQRRLNEKQLGNIKINSFCPGFVPETGAPGANSLFMRVLLRYILPHMPFATSMSDAVNAYVFMALDQSFEVNEGGKAFADLKPLEISLEAKNQEKAERFYDWAYSQIEKFLE